MFKFVACFALLAVASAAPGLIAETHSVIQPAVLAKTAVVDTSSAITHQSYTNLVHKVPVVHTVAAPVVQTYAAPAVPVVKTIAAAPVVHSVPVVKTIAAAPVVHSVPLVKTIAAAPVVHTYATAPVVHSVPVVHAAPLVKTVVAAPVTYIHH